MTLRLRRTALAVVVCVLSAASARAQQGWGPNVSWGGDSRTEAPSAGVNASGSAIVAFVTAPSPPNPTNPLAVFVARRPDPRGAWVDPVAVSGGNTAPSVPQAAVLHDGSAVVVWAQSDGAVSRVRLAELPNGATTWTAPVDLSAGNANANGPRLVACGDVTTVVWLAGGVAQSRRRQGANTFEPVVTLDPSGGATGPVEMAAGPACDVAVAWRRQASGAELVAASARADTGAWSPIAPLSVPGEDPSGPAVSVGLDGRVTVAWRSRLGGRDVVRAARHSSGLWSPVVLAATSGVVNSLALATDRAGAVTAVWSVRSLDSQPNLVGFSRFDPVPGQWSSPGAVKTMPLDIPRAVSLVADRTGTVTLVYRLDLNFDLLLLQAMRFDPFTRAWQTTTTPNFGGSSPVLLPLPNDGAFLAWHSYLMVGAPAFVATADYEAAPPAPSLVATPADRAITLTVTAPPSQHGFEPVTYDYSLDGGATWTPRVPASPSPTFTIEGLTNGQSYSLAVRGVNRSGPGVPSPVVIATPVAVPLAPSDFRVVGRTTTSVTLGWRTDSTPPNDSFVVEGGVQAGQTLVSVPVAASERTLVVSLGPGVYYARVHAVRAGVRSGPSSELTLAQGLPVPPAAPTNLLGLTHGASVALSWTSTLSGGPVEAYRLDVTGATTAAIPLPPGESFSATGVPPGTYRLTVRALNGAGASPPSNPVLLFVPDAACAAPGMPEDLRVTATGRTIRVTWAPPSAGAAVTRYDLLVQGSIAGTFPLATREVTAVANGSFTMRVTAVNDCGASPATAPVSIVVP